jgi:hypothetical protein
MTDIILKQMKTFGKPFFAITLFVFLITIFLSPLVIKDVGTVTFHITNNITINKTLFFTVFGLGVLMSSAIVSSIILFVPFSTGLIVKMLFRGISKKDKMKVM